MVGETLCREVSSDGEHLTQRDAASFPEESMIILFDDRPCALIIFVRMVQIKSNAKYRAYISAMSEDTRSHLETGNFWTRGNESLAALQ
jgi:hypothetical protein